MEQLKPRSNRIVVRAQEAENKTDSGIFIPDTAKEKPNRGVVVATNGSSELKEGDVVLYGKYAGTEINWKGEDLIIMRDEDIYCTIITVTPQAHDEVI